MRFSILLLTCFAIPFLVACQDDKSSDEEDNMENMEMEDMESEINENQAAITGVTVSGSENSYTFAVTIKSPDTGCDQYADWWEIFNEDGDLIYRRILGHSHVDEQPFTRSGGSVEISSNTFVYIRAHMNNLGYGTTVFSGTVDGGFSMETIDVDLHEGIETTEPLPSNCAF